MKGIRATRALSHESLSQLMSTEEKMGLVQTRIHGRHLLSIPKDWALDYTLYVHSLKQPAQ